MAGIRITFKGGSIRDFPRYTTERITELLNEALKRSLLPIAKLWGEEARRLAPRRTGRLVRSLNFKVTGNTKLTIQSVFYTLFVRVRQGDRDFLRRAFENIKQKAIQIIRLNFTLIAGTTG